MNNVNLYLRRFVYNLWSFHKCFFYLLLSYILTVSDNTCTKVTNKMFTSKLLGTHVVVLCRAWKYKFTILAAHVRAKECTNYQFDVAFNIWIFKDVFKSSTFVYTLHIRCSYWHGVTPLFLMPFSTKLLLNWSCIFEPWLNSHWLDPNARTKCTQWKSFTKHGS